MIGRVHLASTFGRIRAGGAIFVIISDRSCSALRAPALVILSLASDVDATGGSLRFAALESCAARCARILCGSQHPEKN